jgi:peroxiredoxin
MRKLFLVLACLSFVFAACVTTNSNKLSKQENDNEKIYQDYIKQISDKYKQKPAPEIDINLLDGTTIKLSDYEGKTILLNFWFINCPPCLTEITSLNEIQRNYKDKDVVIISIGLDDAERLKYVYTAKNIEYLVGSNGKSQGETYGVNVYPTSFLIDKKGIIQDVFVGASDWDATYTYTEIKPSLEKLLQTP